MRKRLRTCPSFHLKNRLYEVGPVQADRENWRSVDVLLLYVVAKLATRPFQLARVKETTTKMHQRFSCIIHLHSRSPSVTLTRAPRPLCQVKPNPPTHLHPPILPPTLILPHLTPSLDNARVSDSLEMPITCGRQRSRVARPEIAHSRGPSRRTSKIMALPYRPMSTCMGRHMARRRVVLSRRLFNRRTLALFCGHLSPMPISRTTCWHITRQLETYPSHSNRLHSSFPGVHPPFRRARVAQAEALPTFQWQKVRGTRMDLRLSWLLLVSLRP